jgi:2-desacetyl-2-hydroxyethyl bacteriochlorophyllide A dehydrogenase
MSNRSYKKIIFEGERAERATRELPETGDGQILIQTVCSLISPGTERAALMRIWDDAGFRENPGYALAGEVIETGPGVRDLQPGDRVITLRNHASLMLASSDPWDTLKIPDGVSYETATFLPLASVALHALRRAQLSLGESVVILGAGIIGLTLVQLARMDGASRVIVLDLAENRLALARQYGADETINPTSADAVARIFEITGGKGAPLIIEATGNVSVLPLAFQLATHGGRIICAGLWEQDQPITISLEFLARELSIIAAHQPHCPVSENLYWTWTQQANRRLLLEMMASGKLHVAEMLTHRFPAQQAPQVYERIKTGDRSMLGVLLEWV